VKFALSFGRSASEVCEEVVGGTCLCASRMILERLLTTQHARFAYDYHDFFGKLVPVDPQRGCPFSGNRGD